MSEKEWYTLLLEDQAIKEAGHNKVEVYKMYRVDANWGESWR